MIVNIIILSKILFFIDTILKKVKFRPDKKVPSAKFIFYIRNITDMDEKFSLGAGKEWGGIL